MGKRYQYVVILKKDSEEKVNLLSLLLCFLSTIIFLYNESETFFEKKIHDTRTYISIAVLAIVVIGFTVSLITWRRTGSQLRYRYLLVATALGWLFMTDIPWIAVLFVLLAFLEAQTRRPLEIGFDQDRVVINMMIKEYHSWREFNNIVLKDGLLTLDFTNNRLLQKEVVEDDDEDNADEDEFNAYCRERLNYR